MMAAGIVLTSLGVVAVGTGVALIDAAEPDDPPPTVRCPTTSGCTSTYEPVDERKRNAGIGLAITGVAMIGAGIPLIVVGARKVPIEDPGEARRRGSPRIREATLATHGTGASLSLSF